MVTIAMAMCPGVDGLSHNEAEEISEEWAAAGADVLFHAVVEPAEIAGENMTSIVSTLHQAGHTRSAQAPVCGVVTDFRLSDDARWKRVRQWSRIRDNTVNILPWINLNPAGNSVEDSQDIQRFKRGGTGWNMIVMSWRWGFDGCIAYNVFPYEDRDPENIENWLNPEARQKISVANSFIAKDIESFDGAIAAWGGNRTAISFVPALVKAIQSERRHPLALWCIRENSDGSPKHPARVSHDEKPKPWRDLEQAC